MKGDDEPVALVGRDTIAAASCLATLLAAPLMVGVFALGATLLDPSPFAGAHFKTLVIGIPFMVVASMMGVVLMPWSAGAALVLTVIATAFITRRKDGSAWRQATPWLLAGLGIGLVVATAMKVEGETITSGADPALLLGSGALTGMAAMLFCRHLVRSFDG